MWTNKHEIRNRNSITQESGLMSSLSNREKLKAITSDNENNLFYIVIYCNT
jgi:hypothetical protein